MVRLRMLITRRRLLAAAAPLSLAACSLLAPRFEKPVVSVVGIRLAGGNLLQQNIVVTFNIQNPNDRVLPVNGLHAEVNVAGERFASGVTNQPFVVPAQGSTQFDLTVTANLALAVLKLSKNSSDPIDYEMTGAASLDLPFLRDLPFQQKGSLSLR